MSKVIIISRHFPAYHPQAGSPTFFVEKFYNAFYEDALNNRFQMPFEDDLIELNREKHKVDIFGFKDSLIRGRSDKFAPKYHTIRKGKRWKAGDMFSPRVWSDVPYDSQQIILAPDQQLKQVWDFEIVMEDGLPIRYIDGMEISYGTVEKLSINDGLTVDEMYHWFKQPSEFSGQILCWNDKISYK